MLIDSIEVTFKAGDGGNGKVSFRRNAKGPDGGSGGNGGNIYLVAESNLFLLNQFTRQDIVQAQNGENGGKNQKTGHSGDDILIHVPVGTSIIDKKNNRIIYEFNQVQEKFLLCKGGSGGKGNIEFKSAEETTPKYAEPGEKGKKLNVILNLKLIADYGLIGLPNAGKSSLLNELTNANAKIANYAFTTLSPNLGVINGKVIADIPGLIEGASEGKGLGIGFLKHIEKVSVILHCISVESKDPEADYKTVRKELEKFNPKMLQKREIILITKTDLVDKSVVYANIKLLKKHSKEVYGISVHDFESLEKLKKVLN